jgi:hypothetical protein
MEIIFRFFCNLVYTRRDRTKGGIGELKRAKIQKISSVEEAHAYYIWALGTPFRYGCDYA